MTTQELFLQFQLGAGNFPGLKHVLIGWEAGSNEPDQNLLPTDIRRRAPFAARQGDKLMFTPSPISGYHGMASKRFPGALLDHYCRRDWATLGTTDEVDEWQQRTITRIKREHRDNGEPEPDRVVLPQRDMSQQKYEAEHAAIQQFIHLASTAEAFLPVDYRNDSVQGWAAKWLIFLHVTQKPERHAVGSGWYQVVPDVFAASVESFRPFVEHVPSELQRDILTALDGRAMTADALEHALNVSRHTLFGGKNDIGGLKELTRLGVIKNDRKIGGYYRPDAPPR